METKENLLQHPARTKLEVMSRGAPHGLWAKFEEMRQLHPPALNQEYVGYREAQYVIEKLLGPRGIADAIANTNESQVLNYISMYHTLATWRISQGIYRFDPDIFMAMLESEFDGEVPGELMLRLPERCVFIETPGLDFTFANGAVSPLIGFWARIEFRDEIDETMLVIQPLLSSLVTSDNILHSYRTNLSWRIDHWADMMVDATVAMYANAGKPRNPEAVRDSIDLLKKWVLPALNLLLYLCTENSEIGDGNQRPTYVAPVQTKRGRRFFPAQVPVRWNVAVRLGAALRSAQVRSENAVVGGSYEMRPHIRRAHWHGVRTGPMRRSDGETIPVHERRFELRWLPPIPVKVKSVEELPATIRPVL